MIAFANFKKLSFPSSMPDTKTVDERKDSRGGSVLDNQDDPSHYKTLNNNIKDLESEEERKPTLKGRRSEEPPDNFAYKGKLIDNSGLRNDNATPESGFENKAEKSRNLNAKIISSHPSNNDQNNRPIQNIMKVGNLFLFNVYKNNEENTTAENVHKIAQNLMRATPVANIELDPLEFGQSNVNDIAVEGRT